MGVGRRRASFFLNLVVVVVVVVVVGGDSGDMGTERERESGSFVRKKKGVENFFRLLPSSRFVFCS